MKNLVGQPSVNGLIYWDYYGPNTDVRTENEICITIAFSSRMSERDTVKSFISLIEINNIQWIRYLKPNWILSSQKFKNQFQNFIFEAHIRHFSSANFLNFKCLLNNIFSKKLEKNAKNVKY